MLAGSFVDRSEHSRGRFRETPLCKAAAAQQQQQEPHTSGNRTHRDIQARCTTRAGERRTRTRGPLFPTDDGPPLQRDDESTTTRQRDERNTTHSHKLQLTRRDPCAPVSLCPSRLSAPLFLSRAFALTAVGPTTSLSPPLHTARPDCSATPETCSVAACTSIDATVWAETGAQLQPASTALRGPSCCSSSPPSAVCCCPDRRRTAKCRLGQDRGAAYSRTHCVSFHFSDLAPHSAAPLRLHREKPLPPPAPLASERRLVTCADGDVWLCDCVLGGGMHLDWRFDHWANSSDSRWMTLRTLALRSRSRSCCCAPPLPPCPLCSFQLDTMAPRFQLHVLCGHVNERVVHSSVPADDHMDLHVPGRMLL